MKFFGTKMVARVLKLRYQVRTSLVPLDNLKRKLKLKAATISKRKIVSYSIFKTEIEKKIKEVSTHNVIFNLKMNYCGNNISMKNNAK